MVKEKLSREQLTAKLDGKQIHPKGMQILLKFEEEKENKTAGGIILPEAQVKETPPFATVVEISSACLSEVAEDHLPKVGDKVLYQKGTQYDLFLNGDSKPSHCLVAWYDILGVVTE